MNLLILLSVQILISLGLILYTRSRVRSSLEAGQVKEEIQQLINAFNRQADTNISLLSDRINTFRRFDAELDERIKQLHRVQLFGQENRTLGDAVEVPERTRASTAREAGATPPPDVSEHVETAARAARPVDTVYRYFTGTNPNDFSSLPPERKICVLQQQGLSEEEIARRLSISVSEVQLYSVLAGATEGTPP